MVLQAFLIASAVAFAAFLGGAFLASSLVKKHPETFSFVSFLGGVPIVLFFGFHIVQGIRYSVWSEYEYDAGGFWTKMGMEIESLIQGTAYNFCFPLSGFEIQVLSLFAIGWLLIGFGTACNVLRDEESVETDAN